MDPLTRACQEYDSYLREGGGAVDLKALGFNTVSERDKTRKLHPSSLGPGLCDRRACYNVMADVGEIEKDIPERPEDNLGHRIGFIFQDYVAQALAYKKALIGMEHKVQQENWTGRIDLMVDPNALGIETTRRYLVDVKTVKGYGLYDRYPKTYHIAQLEMYKHLLGKVVDWTPVLFYVTRVDFQTAMFWWDWEDDSCVVHDYNTGKHNIIHGLGQELQYSIDTQETWLKEGVLPERPFTAPDEGFMCASYQKYGDHRGKYKVNCPFFYRCWEVDPSHGLVFDKGQYGKQEGGYDTTYLPF